MKHLSGSMVLLNLLVCSLLVLSTAGPSLGATSGSPPDEDAGTSPEIDFATMESLLAVTPEDIEFAEEASAESNSGKSPGDILVENSLVFLANEVERLYPNDYATASISHGTLTIGFNGEVPQGLAEEIQHHGLDVHFETNLGTSQRDINAALITTFEELRGLPDVVDASGGYDAHSLSLDFLVTVESGQTAETLSALLTAPAPYAVSLSVVTGPLGTDDSVNGGGRLEVSGESVRECTSGFGISKGPDLGIVTAGHCSNQALTYEDWSGQPETSIGAQDAQHLGEYGDMQIHLFTATSTDDYYSTNNHVLTDVSGVLTPVNGITLCRYGDNTGRQCDEVYAQGHCKLVQDETVCDLTMMNNREAAGGDSGGPWFSSGKAYGIHQGGKFWLFASRDVFSKASNFNLAFGGVIRTS